MHVCLWGGLLAFPEEPLLFRLEYVKMEKNLPALNTVSLNIQELKICPNSNLWDVFSLLRPLWLSVSGCKMCDQWECTVQNNVLILLPAACREATLLPHIIILVPMQMYLAVVIKSEISKQFMKRGRTVLPEQKNNGKQGIIQWFDIALTASSSDSQHSEVKNEKLFFHRSQSNCKENNHPASLKQVRRCSGLGCHSPAITSRRQPHLESSQRERAWKHWVCLSGKENQLQQPLQALFTCRNHTPSVPPLTTRACPGHISTKVLIAQVKINRF